MTGRKVQLAFLSLFPRSGSICQAAEIVLAHFPIQSWSLQAGPPVWSYEYLSVAPEYLQHAPDSNPPPQFAPCLGAGRWGRRSTEVEEEGEPGAVCVNKACCSRQQNPSCRGEAAAFPTDNLMTLAHFHQPNLEHAVGI